MTDHKIGSREEWQAARQELLRREKEHTRMGDELARLRRELPCQVVERSPQRACGRIPEQVALDRRKVESAREHDVERPRAEDAVGDVNVATLRVSSVGGVHAPKS